MVLPGTALVVEIVAVGVFAIIYLISLFVWRPIVERSKLKHKEWSGLMHVASTALAREMPPTSDGVADRTSAVQVAPDRDVYRSAGSTPGAPVHSEGGRHSRKRQHQQPAGRVKRLAPYQYNGDSDKDDGDSGDMPYQNPQHPPTAPGYLPAVTSTMSQANANFYSRLSRRLREFHRAAVASGVALIVGILTIFHISVLVDVTLVVRLADGILINPWRWIFILSLVTGVGHAFVCMAHQHHVLSILMIAFHGGLSRVLLGIALLVEPFSAYFWGVVGGAMLLALISFLLLWFHPAPSAGGVAIRVAGPGGVVPGLTFWWIALTGIVYFVLFFASYEVAAWLSEELTLILFAVADTLFYVLPAVYLLTKHYYKYAKHSWPLLPRFLYADYGLDPYWTIQARPGGAEAQMMAAVMQDGSAGGAEYYASSAPLQDTASGAIQ